TKPSFKALVESAARELKAIQDHSQEGESFHLKTTLQILGLILQDIQNDEIHRKHLGAVRFLYDEPGFPLTLLQLSKHGTSLITILLYPAAQLGLPFLRALLAYKREPRACSLICTIYKT